MTLGERLLRLLPEGAGLGADQWQRRHTFLVRAAWLHVAVVVVWSLLRGLPLWHAAIEWGLVALPLLLLSAVRRRGGQEMLVAGSLSAAIAVVIHLGGGAIESHFQIFIVIFLVGLYQRWEPLLFVTGYVALHHLVVGTIEPAAVFAPDGHQGKVLEWSLVHALFVGAAAAAVLAYWHLSEQARKGERQATDRLTLLAETSRLLASGLDLDATLGDVARLCVPAIADVCALDVIQADGSLRRVAAAAPHPKAEQAAAAMAKNPPNPEKSEHPAITVMRTGEPLVIDEITPAVLERATQNEHHRRESADSGMRSAVVVPLVGRHGVLGTLSFLTVAATGRVLSSLDVPLAEEVARRAAMAVENASLYAQQRTVAETLQRSLLPARLPTVPGLSMAARYRPGGTGAEVGGDWYDVMVLPGGSAGVVLGDVVGRGIPAAALMAQLKHALRAYALDGLSPSEVLSKLNHLLETTEPDHLATVVYSVLDFETGTLRVATAGHLPPIVVDEGRASFVTDTTGLPLGVRPGAVFTEAVTTLRPGATLLLYTDGLVEDRRTDLDEGLTLLSEVVASGPDDLDELCDEVVGRMLEGRDADDDIALLAVRPVLLGDRLDLRLPADARLLATVRATLRRWLGEAGVGKEETHDILLACGEAAANAIEHAGGPRTASFEIEGWIEDGVHLVVRDFGRWRPARPGLRGRGLRVIEGLMDRVQITREDKGTSVYLYRAVSKPRVVQ